MKNNNFLKIATFSFLTLVASCREELPNTEKTNDVSIQESSVKNGRLYFPNKESLQFAYDKVKNADDEAIAKYIDSKNIISLRPVVTKENEKLVNDKLQTRISYLKTNKRFMATKNAGARIANDEEIADDIDDLEEIVGDDAYSAFLNQQAEIQVADEIYKYTDVGLFIVPEENYQELGDYLAVRNISDDLLYPTDESVKENFIESQPTNQRISVDTNIDYFNARIAPIDPDSGGGGGGGGTYYPPVVDPNQQMVNFINGLQNCSPTNGLFDGIFGDSDICKDQYESRYRVKTKAYNYNYYLVYNLGVKVKHQYKGWTGIWRKENCDELRLGVIGGQFSYDYSSYFQYPQTQYNITTIYNNNSRLMFDATTYWSQNGLNITGYSTQGFPKILQDDIVIEQFSNNQYINQAIQAGNKALTADKLNQQFWNYVIPTLGTWWQNLGKPAPTANNITYMYKAPTYGKILIQKTFYNSAYNDDKLEKSFDWGFQVGFNLDPSTGNISPTTGEGLHKPQEFRVLMYGIAKRNGQWHGSKINTINN
ncbi:hypothetical protein OK344_02930 [Kaistella sp. BT6-1-3]|uniref:DUF4848 domain-containing protein n=1 Tax=Kaistella yananensis TaxID=2989820 RepID=A0ABT3JK47_9FLAO|nr:hypothetical protein [Kaistella yananensis]MCW4451156.1 hypothetical protein [Kaistella yananensis]